ncbi:hypothetical protein OEZ85_013587 [Tetradesmus obliquus]|uniref:Leucine-rich repeat-containing N-terminal plant-type domain-containing protein n=1 Tax=Tetradesmus obliquus TaxID=3088 RepID=A0ABY8UTF3_TETOB|nr:hypothetical protein OEZ85_013587 [Tetradesmus obliquus]
MYGFEVCGTDTPYKSWGWAGALPPEWVDAAALRQTVEVAQLPSNSMMRQMGLWPVLKVPLASEEVQLLVGAGMARTADSPTAAKAQLNADASSAEPLALGMLRLRVLDLSVAMPAGGGLSGTLPASYAALEQLQVLILSGHTFNGSLPASWTRLEQLRVFDISHNSITCSLPAWYSSMRQLTVFKANDNQLKRSASGPPEFFEFLFGPTSKLQCLSVAGNKEELLDAAAAAKIAAKAQQRWPPVSLATNEPASSLCDAESWK